MPGREEPPSILLNMIPDVTTRRRVRVLDTHIHDKPLVFSGLLLDDEKIHEMLASSSQRDLHAEAVRQTTRSPLALLTEYFSNNFDRLVEFDPETERRIQADPGHQALLESVRSATTQTIKDGVIKSSLRANEEAPGFRDQARVSRLSLYVGEVVAFKAAQGPIALPDAG